MPDAARGFVWTNPNPNPNPNFRPSPHHHPQPKQVRGFVWKAIAAARATPGFRENGLYQTLALRDDVNEADRVQIDKDVPRTMTGHIFFQVR